MAENIQAKVIEKKCCVIGGGPAGMMCGFLLARAGIDVIVLEKHADFLRDFRGDTVHPSTLELMHELGLLSELLKLPHSKVKELGGQIGDEFIKIADFTHLPTACRFIALMPQWDFLDFLARQAQRYPTFALKMKTEATGIIEEEGRVRGVIARSLETKDLVQIRSDLVIAADGRSSTIRQAAALEVQDLGAPMDVLWFRVARKDSDPPQTLGRIIPGAMMIMLNRGDYWQCGYLIPKGKSEDLKAEGLEAFAKRIVAVVAFLADRCAELKSWDDIKLLTVKVDCLKQWYREGLLCIGDAAHAMSPVGGVGINLAIQDAVAAANLLWKPLVEGRCALSDLRQVQQRRLYPTRMTQRLQVFVQRRVIAPTLSSTKTRKVPAIIKSFNYIPALRTIPAKLIGLGLRPEHIHSPERLKPASDNRSKILS